MNWTSILIATVSASIGPLAVANILAAQGLNIHYGYAGLFNFGQAGFMAVGAYGVAITCASSEAGGYGAPLWAGVCVAILAAVVLALLMGLPALRLRGDYLAIVTIATSEIIRLMLRSEAISDFAGGNSGVNGFANDFFAASWFTNGKRFEWGPFSYLGKDLWVMLIGWIVVAVFALVTFFLMRSPWGRVLRSVRENEDAARSLGKNAQAFKLQALVLGGVMGAGGGIMLALFQNLAVPDDYVTRTTFIAYAAVILGGAARVGGPVIGGVIWYTAFQFMLSLTDEAKRNDLLPESLAPNAALLPFVFLGIALMCLLRAYSVIGKR